jgi:uncharacterized protein YndB with AHSA1/START domain
MADEPADGHSPDSADFEFSSGWQLRAPRTEVWEALLDYEIWPSWWPGLEELNLIRDGDERGIGRVAESRWRGPIGYQFRFSMEAVEIRPHELLRGLATGDLSGQGSFHLSGHTDWTEVRLDWAVNAQKRWMEFLAPVARPVFVYGHDYVMERGAEGLAEYLGVEMRDFHSVS